MYKRNLCNQKEFEKYVSIVNKTLKDHEIDEYLFFGKVLNIEYDIPFDKTKDIDLMVKDNKKEEILEIFKKIKIFGEKKEEIHHEYGFELFFEKIELDVWTMFPGYGKAEVFLKNKRIKKKYPIPSAEDNISLQIGVEKRKGKNYQKKLSIIYSQDKYNVDHLLLSTILKNRYRFLNGRLLIPEISKLSKEYEIKNLCWFLKQMNTKDPNIRELKIKVDKL